jgi:hypothetical protein
MPVEKLVCTQCGAQLKIDPGSNYATCHYCGSELSVTGSTLFTSQDTTPALAKTRAYESLAKYLAELERSNRNLYKDKQSDITQLNIKYKETLEFHTKSPLSRAGMVTGRILLYVILGLLSLLALFSIFGILVGTKPVQTGWGILIASLIGITPIIVKIIYDSYQTRKHTAKKLEYDKSLADINDMYGDKIGTVEDKITETKRKIQALEAERKS